MFNPRGEYNPEMYIQRPEYEQDFSIALRSNLCVLVHGQSGTGKTWLTRRMLEKEKIFYKVVNLANAANCKSIYTCFLHIMLDDNWIIKNGKTETKAAGINVAVASGTLEATTSYEKKVDYFMEFLRYMEHRASDKQKKRYIVFENMEAILDNDELISQLANLITLIDDEKVALYKTQYIIIGATKDIHQYFRRVRNVNTIENRIFELNDVRTLNTLQAKTLIIRGFEKLQIPFASPNVRNFCITEYIRITGGIPQRIHELCLIFAQIVRSRDQSVGVELEQVNDGVRRWIATSLNKNYAYISRLLEREDDAGALKNKILYCVAQIDNLYFTDDDIDKELKLEFPKFMEGKSVRSTKTLDELCKCNPPLLSKTEDVFGEYSFIDFKCALCLRAILKKEGEVVYKNDTYDIG
ncbi:MAG: ATP-binding protein [Lachnospiraceae bacterium]|nr:ATP-binding protein [Lachnospiraceae bacterium]